MVYLMLSWKLTTVGQSLLRAANFKGTVLYSAVFLTGERLTTSVS